MRLAIAAAVACACTLPVAGAVPAPPASRAHTVAPVAPGPLPRVVLALYDGAQQANPRKTPLHALVDMPLGHLGMVVRYHDIRRGLPDLAAVPGLRGVVTWLAGESLPDPRGYLAWLQGLSRRGTPLVVMGAMGAFFDEQGHELPLDDINRVTQAFGWRFEAGWNSTTYGARYTVSDSRFVGFERPFPKTVPPYGRVFSAAADAHVALQVEVPGRPSTRSDLVIVGPRGAFVAPGYTYFSDETGDREFRQRYVNPFELFREAFQSDALPKPDTTTISGRRIYYSHVDGDGWRNVTQIEPYRTQHITSARVVLDEIVKKSADLPVSIGPVVGDIDPAWYGTRESLATATALFAEPNVEAAVHTYSHPFNWQFFAKPRTAAEEQAYGTGEDEQNGSDVVAGGAPRARMYERLPFSIATEMDAAAAFVNRYLPAGKRVELVQWPGDTQPFEAVLARARELGLANINGGDTRFDREFPSAAWVAPVGILVGKERQIYASNSNENTYTDLWRDRFFGFSFLTKTVQNTGAPRRLKPFNLYYHMYSGERLPSLNAVLANLAYARTLSLAPIEASRFGRIAEGFYTTVIEPLGPRVWRVRDRGALQTIRFNDATALAVDFERSRGIVGQRHELGSLYVALDEREPAPTIALKVIAPATGEPADTLPYLVESRWRVFDVTRERTRLHFIAQGFGFGEFTWQWPAGAATVVQWRGRSGRSGSLRVVASPDGVLKFTLPQLTAEPVDVTLVSGDGIGG